MLVTTIIKYIKPINKLQTEMVTEDATTGDIPAPTNMSEETSSLEVETLSTSTLEEETTNSNTTAAITTTITTTLVCLQSIDAYRLEKI